MVPDTITQKNQRVTGAVFASSDNRSLRHRQRAFLAAYSRCFSITEAAKRAKVDRTKHYEWLREDPRYPEAFEAAAQQGIDALEDEAARRGMEKSDKLLMFILSGNKEKYKRAGLAVNLSVGSIREIPEAQLRSWLKEVEGMAIEATHTEVEKAEPAASEETAG